jgi:glutamyl-tRNA synthetase
MTIRTRFAPSPTGYLHIGGARTALYSWLFAKVNSGEFILRIEDTDLERSTQEAVDAILEGMAWLNLDYDEGPFFQMQRMDRYQEVIEQLLKEGKAYRCYCSKERLEKLREEQLVNKQKPRYDGHCRNLTQTFDDQPFVIRFKNPTEGGVTFNDQVRGTITFQNSELDDLIIARTDGTPTYNFTVVVDDMDMKITHVIRGDDHINNTPRQINILNALDATPPIYAHLPMILGSDGKRLSKRHGAVSVLQYRDEGYLPEALINYLVRLGWSYGDQEIFTLDELQKYFSLKNISRSPATFNPEKLLWLNQHYIKNLDPNHVAQHLSQQFTNLGIDISQGPPLTAIIEAQKDRAKTLQEIAQKSLFFYTDHLEYDEEAIGKEFNETTPSVLAELNAALSELTTWDKENIHSVIKEVAEKNQLKMGKVAQPLRIAVSGSTASPSIDLTLVLLGKEKTLRRLNAMQMQIASK